MRSNKGRDTAPELALRRAVHARGLRYRVSARPLREIRRTADLVFTRARVAVFLDGCFWHGCPIHHTVAATNAGFWADKVETNRRREKQVAYNTAHGVDPTPLRKKIADILDQVYREADDTESVEVGGSGRNASRGRRAQGAQPARKSVG